MNIKTTPDQHLEMMRNIDDILKHFASQDSMEMYKKTVAVREHLQHLADDYALMRITIDRMVINNKPH